MESLKPIDQIRAAIERVFSVSSIEESVYSPLVELMIASIQSDLGGGLRYVHARDKTPRNNAIVKCFRERLPRKKIAEKFGVSESTVNQVIQKYLNGRFRKESRTGLGSDHWNL